MIGRFMVIQKSPGKSLGLLHLGELRDLVLNDVTDLWPLGKHNPPVSHIIEGNALSKVPVFNRCYVRCQSHYNA